MKRVYCLYRVSTAQQVDVVKDDILTSGLYGAWFRLPDRVSRKSG